MNNIEYYNIIYEAKHHNEQQLRLFEMLKSNEIIELPDLYVE